MQCSAAPYVHCPMRIDTTFLAMTEELKPRNFILHLEKVMVSALALVKWALAFD